MRIRTIKPEWLSDEKMGMLSDSERVLSVGLILMADDHGRGRANPALIRSTVWPYADPPEPLQKITDKLHSLSGIGFIVIYSIDDQEYYEICNWSKHQRISHPGNPIIQAPPEPLQKVPEPLQKVPQVLQPEREKEKEKEGNGVRACPREVTTSGPSGRDEEWFSTDTVTATFSRLRVKAGGSKFRSRPQDYLNLESVVEWAKSEARDRGITPVEVVERCAQKYFENASERIRAQGWPLGLWACDLGAWLGSKNANDPDDKPVDYSADNARILATP